MAWVVVLVVALVMSDLVHCLRSELPRELVQSLLHGLRPELPPELVVSRMRRNDLSASDVGVAEPVLM